jgi:hypothetical protein
VEKWQTLLKYDKEIALVADKLSPLGERWVDQFARDFLKLNDKRYLPEIVKRVIADAREPPASTSGCSSGSSSVAKSGCATAKIPVISPFQLRWTNGMARHPQRDDEPYSSEEAERRFIAAVKAGLNTKPKPLKSMTPSRHPGAIEEGKRRTA